jgi:hypothetical protein
LKRHFFSWEGIKSWRLKQGWKERKGGIESMRRGKEKKGVEAKGERGNFRMNVK